MAELGRLLSVLVGDVFDSDDGHAIGVVLGVTLGLTLGDAVAPEFGPSVVLRWGQNSELNWEPRTPGYSGRFMDH